MMKDWQDRTTAWLSERPSHLLHARPMRTGPRHPPPPDGGLPDVPNLTERGRHGHPGGHPPGDVFAATSFAILQKNENGKIKIRRGEDWRRSLHNATVRAWDVPIAWRMANAKDDLHVFGRGRRLVCRKVSGVKVVEVWAGGQICEPA